MLKRPKSYAGIGARATPPEVLSEMLRLGEALAPAYGLRSSGAEGADSAFESGALRAGGRCRIFLPWKGYRQHLSPLYGGYDEARALARTLHPSWEHLSEGERKLHAQACFQVLERTLDDPADFVVCWTKDGCESAKERQRTSGGTATAVVLAERYGVPVFNLQKPASRERLVQLLREDDDLDVSWLLRPTGPVQLGLF